jgi:hypothetical protein
MNLLELVTHLRRNILHDTGGTGVDWANISEDEFDSVQLRWSNEELTSNINEAINMVYRRAEPIKVISTINVIANTHTYPLPTATQKISKVKREDGEALEEKSISELWDLKGFDTDTGDLKYYSTDLSTGTIRFYRIPEVNESVYLLLYRYPTSSLTWTLPATTPELDSRYHLPMLFYAAHLCYLKDEANTLDPQRATNFLGMFDREFPFTSVYSNIRKSRTANRPVRYGGL